MCSGRQSLVTAKVLGSHFSFSNSNRTNQDIYYNTIHITAPIHPLLCTFKQSFAHCVSVDMVKKKIKKKDREQIESFNKIFSHLLLLACRHVLYWWVCVCVCSRERGWRLKDVTTLLFTATTMRM